MINILDLAPILLGLVLVFGLVFRKFQLSNKTVSDSNSSSKGLVKKTSSSATSDCVNKPQVKCYFGSQTGTAEGYAKQIASLLNNHGFKAHIVDLEEFDRDDFESNTEFAVFVMATYGEGEPCDNSIEFIDFLKKTSEDGGPDEGFASKVKFTVFGLGNTEYEHYNAMGRLVFKRITELGGEEIHPLGEGDDSKDMEEDYSEWSTNLVANFRKAAGMEKEAAAPSGSQMEEGETEYKFKAAYVPEPQDRKANANKGRITAKDTHLSHRDVDLSSRHFYQGVPATITENRELRAKTFENGGSGSTVHVEIDLKGTGLKYNTADNLSVCPANDASQVKLAARYLRLDLKQWFILESVNQEEKEKPLFPTPCTVETALTYFTDLNGSPSRSLLGHLASLATLPEHRERLHFLASKDGKNDYISYITDRKLSICEIFETFPSIKITEDNMGGFFEVMPRLKCREFTIASSSNYQPDRVALTVGVVREQKPGAPEGRILNGVCSTFIKNIRPEMPETQKALIFVKESTFKLPKNPETPIIMIGPGTGIAPMRAFIQDRKHQRDRGVKTGDSILFFGCRRSDEDYIYREELAEALESGALTRLFTAFSREQKEKVYVQHLLAREQEMIWEYIDTKKAYVYVCGATSMGKDVHSALQTIVQQHMTTDAARAYMAKLQEQHRYVQELWSS